MTGGTVTYTFADGSTVVKSGTFDLYQVHKVRQQLEAKYQRRVISTRVVWAKLRVANSRL